MRQQDIKSAAKKSAAINNQQHVQNRQSQEQIASIDVRFMTPQNILTLQRMIGNQQTQLMLNQIQRDDTTPTPSPIPKPTKANIETAKHHVTVGDGVKNNVSGCHDEVNFRQLATDGLISITREEPTSIAGVKQLFYKVYKKDGSGELKNKENIKTVYDPGVWSWDRLVQVATAAAIDAHANGGWGTSASWAGSGSDAAGKGPFNIGGYQEGGNAKTFFFKE